MSKNKNFKDDTLEAIHNIIHEVMVEHTGWHGSSCKTCSEVVYNLKELFDKMGWEKQPTPEESGHIEVTAWLNGFTIDEGGERETRVDISWNSSGLFATVEHKGKEERWQISWQRLFQQMLNSIWS